MVRAKGRRLGQDHTHGGSGSGGSVISPSDIILPGVNIDADSVDINDDERLNLGSDNDWSIRYDSNQASFVIEDEANNQEKIKIDDGGNVEVVPDLILDGIVDLTGHEISHDDVSGQLQVLDDGTVQLSVSATGDVDIPIGGLTVSDRFTISENGPVEVKNDSLRVGGMTQLSDSTGNIEAIGSNSGLAIKSLGDGNSYISIHDSANANNLIVAQEGGPVVVQNATLSTEDINAEWFNGKSAPYVYHGKNINGNQDDYLAWSYGHSSVSQTSGSAPVQGVIENAFSTTAQSVRWDDTSTYPVEIEIDFGGRIHYWDGIGVSFAFSRHSSNIDIEVYDANDLVWNSIYSTTTNDDNVVRVGGFQSHVSRIRFRFSGIVSSSDQIAVERLFAFTGQQGGSTYLERGGGEVHGSLTIDDTIGSIVLPSSFN